MNISAKEIQKAISKLTQVIYSHQQWHDDIIRTLISRSSYDKHDLLPEAYKECRFGQWYYDHAPDVLRNHQTFKSLGASHKKVHGLAAVLLNEVISNNPISDLDYEHYASAYNLFHLELITLKKELETLLTIRDPLTSAINRLNMLEMLNEQHALVKRGIMKSVLVMIDIDIFKQVNDNYGHSAGDFALTTVAHTIMDNLRLYDKLFRYGGDEFLICLQQIDMKQAYDLVDRLRDKIAHTTITFLDHIIHLTISCGIADLEANLTVQQAIDHADKAAYEAKLAGRNRTKIWEG